MGWQGGIASLAFHSGTGNGNILNQSTVFFGVAGNTSSASVFPATLTINGGGARGYAVSDNFSIPALLFH